MEDVAVYDTILRPFRSFRRRPAGFAKSVPAPAFDPLSHPAIRRMSPRELADLPLGALPRAGKRDRAC